MKRATATPKHFICRTFKRGEKTVQQTPQNGDLLKYFLCNGYIPCVYIYIYGHRTPHIIFFQLRLQYLIAFTVSVYV